MRKELDLLAFFKTGIIDGWIINSTTIDEVIFKYGLIDDVFDNGRLKYCFLEEYVLVFSKDDVLVSIEIDFDKCNIEFLINDQTVKASMHLEEIIHLLNTSRIEWSINYANPNLEILEVNTPKTFIYYDLENAIIRKITAG